MANLDGTRFRTLAVHLASDDREAARQLVKEFTARELDAIDIIATNMQAYVRAEMGRRKRATVGR